MDRGDGDNGTAAGRDHRWNGILAGIEGSIQDSTATQLPVSYRHIDHGAAFPGGCIVHQYVQPPELSGRRLDKGLYLLRAAHVAQPADRTSPGCCNLLRRGAPALVFHIANDDPGALLRVGERDLAADALCRSGDNGNFPW